MAITPWGIAGVAMTAAGQTMAAVGQFKSQMAQAAMTREKAKLKGLARKEIGYRALVNLQNQRLEYQQQVGQTSARMGGSGVDVGDSTSMEIRQNAEKIQDRNRDNAIREHSYEARTMVTEEKNLRTQAASTEKAAKISLAANIMIAAGNAAQGVIG